jgi:DNA-directed RNA polymerase subunit RPC12/RpoP
MDEKDIMSADMVEVVHGRWDYSGNCSACGKNIYNDIDADMWSRYAPPYCPNCGAKMMDGDKNA